MENLILVFNCGSSSLKGAVIDYKTGKQRISYLAEKLNLTDAYINIQYEDETKEFFDLAGNPSHLGAVEVLMDSLHKHGLTDAILAVGHRVVHGGEMFKDSCLVTDEVIENIRKCITLAPLHNPANLLGIEAAEKVFSNIPQVVVFDTAFHQTMAPEAYLYAIPYEYYEKYAIRKYGMHGTSYRYISEKADTLLNPTGQKSLALVIAHLGNGASLCAVKDGKSHDTTMGLSPLEGLMMGTRSGDIDPSIFSFLNENTGMNIAETTNMLNKNSGLLGISGLSSDMRSIVEAIKTGDTRAQLAIDMFVFRLAKYIAAMAASIGRIDALVFSGGIGENSTLVRQRVLEKLNFMGFEIDEALNQQCIRGKAGTISKSTNPLALVIPTNEELMIAKDTAAVVGLT